MFPCSSVAPVITILKFFKSNTITVRKGAAVDIPAEVKALPLAALRWTKDDTVIEKPDEEKMTMETEEVRTGHLSGPPLANSQQTVLCLFSQMLAFVDPSVHSVPSSIHWLHQFDALIHLG